MHVQGTRANGSGACVLHVRSRVRAAMPGLRRGLPPGARLYVQNDVPMCWPAARAGERSRAPPNMRGTLGRAA